MEPAGGGRWGSEGPSTPTNAASAPGVAPFCTSGEGRADGRWILGQQRHRSAHPPGPLAQTGRRGRENSAPATTDAGRSRDSRPIDSLIGHP